MAESLEKCFAACRIESRVQKCTEENMVDESRNATLEASNATVSPPSFWLNAGRKYDADHDYHQYDDVQIGAMSTTCTKCKAKKWSKESAGMCCSGGKVILPDLGTPPKQLESLLNNASPDSKDFFKNIQSYNKCFSMTSFHHNLICETGYMPTFKVCGQISHKLGSLFPIKGKCPQFLQIYFMKNENPEKYRHNLNPQTKLDIIVKLQDIFNENTYIKDLTNTINNYTRGDKMVIRADKTLRGRHGQSFNVSRAPEIEIVKDEQEIHDRDIILHRKNDQLQCISRTNRAYDALQYPIIHWAGQDGYYLTLCKTDPQTTQLVAGEIISSNDFYAYRIMVREDSFNMLIRCQDLFRQYIVDMYTKIEHEKLMYISSHQSELRVTDSLSIDDNTENADKLKILPATFIGGPRYMNECIEDGMVYVEKYGNPDLFITFTCNPKWPEIVNELLPNQKPHDRHDLKARVFHLKLGILIQLLTKRNIFGVVVAYMYTVEWQKRGLPHAHCLVWLEKKLELSDIDSVISAEIPDPVADPVLHNIILDHMIHTPCGNIKKGALYMQSGTKKYPKQISHETRFYNGEIQYRRRYTTAIHNKKSIDVDNKWVVPYNKLLSKIFNAHINVEYCTSNKPIEYICKGNVKAKSVDDEIKYYETNRCISTNEAIWKILNFPIHVHHPPVFHLSVHLENGEGIYFTESTATDLPPTTLTAFFKLCQTDDLARTLLYPEVPKHYIWDAENNVFEKRLQDDIVPEVLSRVYTVQPNEGERYYLRLLLHHIRGPQKFDDLKTIDGQVMNTFKDACSEYRLLEDEDLLDCTL